jgi:hypothetical protein
MPDQRDRTSEQARVDRLTNGGLIVVEFHRAPA